ncbi:DNA starvation/stationary phase protection protein [uncultured Roseovarius sp.]|uniref:Dps family protein n=1 Tax=uncultured Roseovarius sp. TaxID=293344 RepID=UPI00260E18D0|nr:DNA starvation/stationary phase protection protein [uncultured Roseovarius sp.]
MQDMLQAQTQRTETDTGVRDTKAVADGLTNILADTYRLVFKTHAYHWNVTGPMFYSIHKLTEEQYENMFKAADTLAERIRALGEIAPMTLSTVTGNSVIGDKGGRLTARQMVVDLADDHERIAHRLHDLIETAGDHRDPVTEDLATARAAFHEEATWMLRAIAAE